MFLSFLLYHFSFSLFQAITSWNTRIASWAQHKEHDVQENPKCYDFSSHPNCSQMTPASFVPASFCRSSMISHWRTLAGETNASERTYARETQRGWIRWELVRLERRKDKRGCIAVDGNGSQICQPNEEKRKHLHLLIYEYLKNVLICRT